MSEIELHGTNRRGVMRAAIGAAVGAIPLSASTAEPTILVKAPGFYRFNLGEAVITAVSDGRVYSGDPKKTFRAGKPEEITSILTDNFLETDRVVLEENVIVADIGNRRVLFDCGVGHSSLFGKSGGRLLANLAAAGISGSSIDAVVLSHGHPDHIGGLMSVAGERNFPNAQLYLSQAEFDFWTSAERTGPSLAAFHALANEQLGPNRDRLLFITDGQEILPGVQAMSSPGHTIGHMHFVLNSDGQTLAWTADLTRHHILGLEKRWEFVGDYDPAQSLNSLDRYVSSYADERVLIMSYHYPWPGIGHFVRWNGAYRYLPARMDVASD